MKVFMGAVVEGLLYSLPRLIVAQEFKSLLDQLQSELHSVTSKVALLEAKLQAALPKATSVPAAMFHDKPAFDKPAFGRSYVAEASGRSTSGHGTSLPVGGSVTIVGQYGSAGGAVTPPPPGPTPPPLAADKPRPTSVPSVSPTTPSSTPVPASMPVPARVPTAPGV